MKKIYYFQRYSQKENWVTNNTLLLLSRIHEDSSLRFETILNNLLGESVSSVEIGPSFYQQEKKGTSIPDGLIAQTSFKIKIETKLGGNDNIDQLKRHIDGFEHNHHQKILISLSKFKLKDSLIKEINSYIKSKDTDVKFVSLTFEELIKTIDQELDEYDLKLREILEEYQEFCESENLIEKKKSTMLVVTAGKSLNENVKYHIYYDPTNRNHNMAFGYLGLYDSKSIQYVGKLQKTFYADYDGEKLIPTNKDNPSITEEEKKRIISIIEETDYYDISKGVKFFLVDKFEKTDYRKISHSSLRGKKYFDLTEIEGFKENLETNEIAELLKNKVWE